MSDDRVDKMDRAEDRDVEGHVFDKAEKNEKNETTTTDVEGHMFDKAEKAEKAE